MKGLGRQKILLGLLTFSVICYGAWTLLREEGMGQKPAQEPPQREAEKRQRKEERGIEGEAYSSSVLSEAGQAPEESRTAQEGSNSQASSDVAPPVVYVHVDGAVARPGLYACRAGERVADALKKAGDPLHEADLREINLAQKLVDESKIYVPRKGETEPPRTQASVAGPGKQKQAGRIDLNHASLEELQTLPSVGETRAREIVAYREKTPFQKPEDLMAVSGIGPKTFDRLKDRIEVR